MALSVLGLYDTGSLHQLNGRPAPEDTRPDERQDQLYTCHRPAYLIPAGLGVLALFSLGGYLVAEAHHAPRPVWGLLLVALGIFGLGGVLTLGEAISLRFNSKQARHLRAKVRGDIYYATREGLKQIEPLGGQLAALAQAVVDNRQILQDLGSVPGEVRTRVQVLNDQLDRRYRDIGQQVQRIADTVEKRLGELEQKLTRTDPTDLGDDAQLRKDDRYLAGYADGLADRAIGTGAKVLPLNEGHSRLS